MVTVNINNNKYRIPERLTIKQYSAALQFDWEDPKYYPMIVSQLIGAPLKQLVKADEQALELAIGFIVNSMNDRKECEIIDFDHITFGEFIDLDVYLAMGLDKHFEDIANMVAPEAKWADEAMWAIDRFASFRMFTYRQYQILFGLRDEDVAHADDIPDSKVDQLAVARSWYKIIVSLAQENILQIDAVTEQPLKKALNFMALQKEKAMAENEARLKQKRQYDLSRTRR